MTLEKICKKKESSLNGRFHDYKKKLIFILYRRHPLGWSQALPGEDMSQSLDTDITQKVQTSQQIDKIQASRKVRCHSSIKTLMRSLVIFTASV